MDKNKSLKISVLGGGGRIGLPLSLAFAGRGLRVHIYDINEEVIDKINSGVMPFYEEGTEDLLKATLGKNLTANTSPDELIKADYIIIIIGTPVDEHLSPSVGDILNVITDIRDYIVDGQCIIMRSTVYPGTTEKVHNLLQEINSNVSITYCPERVAEGVVLKELETHPQIISAFNEEGFTKAEKLFKYLTNKIIRVEPIEAELSKLFTNVWRYIRFATTNQFYMIAEEHGADYHKILKAISDNYDRMNGFPGPGFAAGPCLLKDTMQLAAFAGNSFYLGHAAMIINEGLPNFMVRQLKKQFNLKDKSVGILGMAFKSENDDTRESLSYKLRKLLLVETKKVLCNDIFIGDEVYDKLEILLDKSDILILAVPHKKYKNLKIRDNQYLLDVWDFLE